MSQQTARAGDARLIVAAELSLVAVTVAAVLGLGRLFADGSFLGPVLTAALGAHLLGAVCRRRGWGLPASLAVSCVGLALVVGWLRYSDTTAWGLPTWATREAAGADLSRAWELFGDVKAPASVEDGFVLAAMLATWTFAFAADWAAFRAGGRLEAVLPTAVMVVFTSTLAAPRWRGAAIGLYFTTVVIFLLLQRLVEHQSASAWLTGDAWRGSQALLRAGTTLGVVAMVVGLVLGPALPGEGAEEVVALKGRSGSGSSSRITVSPLVTIRKQLVENSDLEAFTVRATRPAYWRLTALERFDGEIWSSHGRYQEASGELPGGVPVRGGVNQVVQRFEIKALSQIWLPAAYEARRVEGGDDATYDAESGTLLTQKDTSDGQIYRVVSEVPHFVDDELRKAPTRAPDDLEEYLELPGSLSPRLEALARSVTERQETLFDVAFALEQYFRINFVYDQGIPEGQDTDAIDEFLDSRRGYCEQFAGTYAAMARTLGIPARVAVGFTSGERDPNEPNLYHVHGYHAHAWPEVFLEQYGWVAFDPTPGRTPPDAEGYLGRPSEQAAQNASPTTSTTAPTGTTTPAGTPGSDRLPEGALSVGGDIGTEVSPPTTQRPLLRRAGETAKNGGIGLLGLAAVWVLVVPLGWLVVRQRRRRAATRPRDQVRVAWTEAMEGLALAGATPRPGETAYEFAQRAGALTGLPLALLLPLAGQATAAAYGVDEPDGEDAEQAYQSAKAVSAALAGRTPWWRRLLWALDPRPRLPRTSTRRTATAAK